MPADPWRGMNQSTNILSNLHGQRQSQQQNALRNQYTERQLGNQESQNAFNRGMQNKKMGMMEREEQRAQAQNEFNQLVEMENLLRTINSQGALDRARAIVEKRNPKAAGEAPKVYDEKAQIWLRGETDKIANAKKHLVDMYKVTDAGVVHKKAPRSEIKDGFTEGKLTPKKTTNATPKVGDIRNFQRGDKTVTEEYTTSGWVEKAEGNKWNPTQRNNTPKPDVTPKQAVDMVAKIKKGMAEFSKTGLLDAFLAKELKGQGIDFASMGDDPESKKKALDAMQVQLEYYKEFLPENEREKFFPTKPTTEPISSNVQTATNPKTKERLYWDGEEWNPMP